MDWPLIARNFAYDGSLRDIYIRDTSMYDWAVVWQLLTSDLESLQFRVDGVSTEPPAKVEGVFTLYGSHSLCATYALGRQRLNCHFFVEEEIEFDLDSRDVDGSEEAERLIQFLARLGRATGKEVRLTHENGPEEVIAFYDPTCDRVTWTTFPDSTTHANRCQP